MRTLFTILLWWCAVSVVATPLLAQLMKRVARRELVANRQPATTRVVLSRKSPESELKV